jgi:hypothetical protein
MRSKSESANKIPQAAYSDTFLIGPDDGVLIGVQIDMVMHNKGPGEVQLLQSDGKPVELMPGELKVVHAYHEIRAETTGPTPATLEFALRRLTR